MNPNLTFPHPGAPQLEASWPAADDSPPAPLSVSSIDELRDAKARRAIYAAGLVSFFRSYGSAAKISLPMSPKRDDSRVEETN
jgi:hypothetical protein